MVFGKLWDRWHLCLSATSKAESESISRNLSPEESDNLLASYKIEASYIGHIGKWMEPAISPLGFDWKIGIAILTSFAAREVFVGTMATIYSIGSDNDEQTLRQKMADEVRPGTDIKVYNTPTALSLLVFLCLCYSMYEYLGHRKNVKTNTWKMADHSVSIYECHGLFRCFDCISAYDVSVLNSSTIFLSLLSLGTLFCPPSLPCDFI